jgi:hypothetical protein
MSAGAIAREKGRLARPFSIPAPNPNRQARAS